MPLRSFKDTLILNVDDSDGARYAKSRILIRAGLRVIEASCGEDALARARNEMPALILLDVKLPDINGFEVCRRLKEDPVTQPILILQTSASFIGAADKIRALDGGADNYLVEPIEPDELIANVKALLRLGKVERELREVDRRKDEFLATLAHELRNPLGPIRTSLQLLRRLDPDVPSAQENARNTIERHTNHMVRLVDDLLDVARISQGKITLRHEIVNLQSVVNNAVEICTPAIENKAHRLTLVLPGEPVDVSGDPVRLSQILANLLLNAAKFTPTGGEIVLTVDIIESQVCIRVTDNGIGIEPDAAQGIFELFIQNGHVKDQVQDGLGIGLSLVKNLAELHGGTVSVLSEGAGKGSTFEVMLPIVVQTSVAASAPEEPVVVAELEADLNANPAKKVLIVDDNKDAADTLAELLTMTGHGVNVAYNGEQALKAAQQFDPDIIFLDIGLPDMSGYEVASRLRASAATKACLLVALTGYGQEHDRQNALQSGFDDHFAKPVDFKKLAALGLTV